MEFGAKTPYYRKYDWPELDEAKRKAVLTEFSKFTLADLRVASTTLTPEIVLPQLYPPKSLLCCGARKFHNLILPIEGWVSSSVWSQYQFIVPNPMLAQFCYDAKGNKLYDKAGKPSVRLMRNVAYRRYLIVEFDTGSIDEHAGLIAHLSHYGPLIMVVHSAGKSLHAWFNCVGQKQSFFRYACRLGADKAHWNIHQYTRLPGGSRGRLRQEILYFNPRRVA